MIKMKITEVLNCSFSSWYPKFKDFTTKSQIIPLPQEFLDYLLADQVVLPEGTITASTEATPDEEQDNRYNENFIDWSTEDILTPVAEPPSFPEFESLLKATIKRLGGKVFPKLNWSAPRDATWISFDKTLKCTCPSDIYLLLKSSDFISHDLTQPFIQCDDDENLRNETAVKYELILRKWQEFNPANEFRCFVKHNQIIGICQRHTDMFNNFIRDQKDEIIADAQAFFYHVIKDNFPDKSFCFDVYRRNQGKLLLLDFNPFGPVTDSLLFTWDELEGENLYTTPVGDNPSSPQGPIFRCVESSSGVQPNPYGTYAVPKDFIDIASGEDPSKLMDLLHLKIQQQNGEDSSEEEPDQTSHPT